MTSHRSSAFLVSVVGLALVLGCDSSQDDGGAPGAASEASSASSIQDVVDGYYVFGHEVNTFSPCASSDTYWVVARTDSLRVAYDEWFTASGAEPYAPMFARFRGGVSSGPLDGFAEAYDGLFTVEEVHLLRGIEEGDCEPVGSPLYSGWRAVASADFIVRGDLVLADPQRPAGDSYAWATIRWSEILKGVVDSAPVLRYYAPEDGAELVRRAGQDNTISDVLVFVAREESLLYQAGDLEASIVTADLPIVDSVRAEVAQQQHIRDPAITPVDARSRLDRRMLDDLAGPPSRAQRVLAELMALDCGAVPRITPHLGDVRPLLLPSVEIEVSRPDWFESVAHYKPEVVTDLLSIVLSEITGESFGSIANGGSVEERTRVVRAWQVYTAYLQAGAIDCPQLGSVEF